MKIHFRYVMLVLLVYMEVFASDVNSQASESTSTGHSVTSLSTTELPNLDKSVRLYEHGADDNAAGSLFENKTQSNETAPHIKSDEDVNRRNDKDKTQSTVAVKPGEVLPPTTFSKEIHRDSGVDSSIVPTTTLPTTPLPKSGFTTSATFSTSQTQNVSKEDTHIQNTSSNLLTTVSPTVNKSETLESETTTEKSSDSVIRNTGNMLTTPVSVVVHKHNMRNNSLDNSQGHDIVEVSELSPGHFSMGYMYIIGAVVAILGVVIVCTVNIALKKSNTLKKKLTLNKDAKRLDLRWLRRFTINDVRASLGGIPPNEDIWVEMNKHSSSVV